MLNAPQSNEHDWRLSAVELCEAMTKLRLNIVSQKRVTLRCCDQVQSFGMDFSLSCVQLQHMNDQ